jgi:hypothetical protein
VEQVAGPPASVTEQLSPQSVPADGKSSVALQAKVTDAFGNPVEGGGVHVGFKSNNGQRISPTSEYANGVFKATLTASTTIGTSSVTAYVGNPDSAVNDRQSLDQVAGPPNSVIVTVKPGSIPADGTSTATAVAKVTDASGHPAAGDAVAFTSSDPGQLLSPPTLGLEGSYSVTVRASTTLGTATITATDSSVSPAIAGSARLTQTGSQAAPAAKKCKRKKHGSAKKRARAFKRCKKKQRRRG